MKLVKLTRPDGSPVWIAVAWVQRVKPPDDRHGREAHAVVCLSGCEQAVVETPEEVAEALRVAAAG